MRKVSALFLSLSFSFLALVSSSSADSCADCHQELENKLKAPVEGFKSDVHQRFGLSCVSCHGGNPEEDDLELAKDKSFKGSPRRSQIPEFCGECHSNSGYMRGFNPNLRVDQLELYWTSQHGLALKQGDTKAAVCTDCHSIHGILEASHPKSLTFPWNVPETCSRCHSDQNYMKSYKIPTSQLEDYRGSVHAHALYEKKDLSAPVCNDCHGNHGAMPPEVSAIAFVCRQCHPSTGELFSQSPHKKAYDEMGISECEACHGNHRILPTSDEMLGAGDKALCIQCHEPDTRAYDVVTKFKSSLDSCVKRIHAIEEILEKAEKQGVEVGDAKFKLRDASSLLILSRNLTHSLNLADFDEKIEEGNKILEEVKRLGEEALAEAKFRKTGLVIATLFIFLLAIALFLKIRQIEKKTS